MEDKVYIVVLSIQEDVNVFLDVFSNLTDAEDYVEYLKDVPSPPVSPIYILSRKPKSYLNPSKVTL